MKTKRGLRTAVLTAVFFCISGPVFAVLSGAGTEASPYLIQSRADFDEFADPNNAALYWASSVYTQLMCDPNLADTTYTQAVIAPDISTNSGFQGTPFTGVFDGNGHTISNLAITASSKNYIGLIGCIGTNGHVKNLGVKDSTVIGGSNSRYVGGLIGMNSSGHVTNCHSSVSIRVDGIIGGLVGTSSGLIEDSYSTGTVIGAFCVGGLVGWNHSGNITNCYSTCNAIGNPLIPVVASWYFGGLVGENDGSVTNCFASGDVSGILYTGGLIGENAGDVTNCYSISKVYGNSSVGGFMGRYYSGNLADNFWDVQTSDTIDGVANKDPDPAGVTGKTTAQMMTLSTFTAPAVNWDFTATDGDAADWMMLRESEDYPRLAWQAIYPGDIAGLYGVDMADLMEVVNHWLEQGCPAGCEQADIDGSGQVDLGDAAIVGQNWLKGR